MFGTILTGDREMYALHHDDDDDDDFTEEQHTRLDFPFHGPDLESYIAQYSVWSVLVMVCSAFLMIYSHTLTYLSVEPLC